MALQFFHVSGPRQALSPLGTRVLSILAFRYRNGVLPLVYKDGYQQRDVVIAYDLVRGCRLAIEGFHVDENEYHMGLVHWDGQRKPAYDVFRERLHGKRCPRPFPASPDVAAEREASHP